MTDINDMVWYVLMVFVLVVCGAIKRLGNE